MKKVLVSLLMMVCSFAANAQSTCSSCQGYGTFRCSSCGGNGVVYQQVWNPYYGVYHVPYRCGTCNGYGVLICSNCGGQGIVNSDNSSFHGRTAYYAECSHDHGCKLYVPTSAGDSYCATCRNNGHKCLKSAHVKRYY